MAAGLTALLLGAAAESRRAHPLPLGGLTLSALEEGRWVSGSGATLLAAPGKGVAAGQLFPLSGENALTGETGFVLPIGGEGEYVTLLATAGEAEEIRALFAAGEPIPVCGVLRRGVPFGLDYPALLAALGVCSQEAVDARVSPEYSLRLTENAPSPLLAAGAAALLLGAVMMVATRRDILWR